jgi:hypothetical protein
VATPAAVTLPKTDLSRPNNVRYFGRIFDSRGTPQTYLFEDMHLRATLGNSITYQGWWNDNQQIIRKRIDGVPTTDEMNTAIALAGLAGKRLVVVDVSGTGTVTFDPSVFVNSVVKLVGTLTGTRTVNWDNALSVETTIWNATSGGFDLFVKSTGEATGLKIPLNLQAGAINDGIRVYLQGLSGDVNTVLTFDGVAQHVNFGVMWPDQTASVNYGQTLWEFWCKPLDGAQYIISDGYGGIHAMLFGFSGTDGTGHTSFQGNMFSSLVAFVSFGGGMGPAIGEWCHVAVAWNGTTVNVYYNGVPITAVPFAGPRITPGSGGGGGVAFIAGSDHQNFKGSIAQVRAFEGFNPLSANDSDGISFIPQPFVPANIFSAYFNAVNDPALPQLTPATLVASFLQPINPIPNLSINTADSTRARTGVVEKAFVGSTSSQFPAPQFVQDPGAPNYSSLLGPTLPVEVIDIPPATPGGCKIFDSFSRRNQTFAFQTAPVLGSTEAGSLGIKTWINGTPFPGFGVNKIGILRGRAVTLLPSAAALAYVTGVSNEVDVRVSRSIGLGFQSAALNTGIAFRVQNDTNFCFATTIGITETVTQVLVGYVEAAVTTIVATVSMPASWTVLRVVTTGSSVQVFGDSTLVTTQTVNKFLSATGAGLFYRFFGAGFGCRWDDFTVF